MRQILGALVEGRDLTEGEAGALLDALTDPGLDPVLAGALLIALKSKGEKVPELRAFARGMRDRALDPGIEGAADAVDLVGTGGDLSGSLNLSTGAALLVAACGQPVIKHGNRSVSSRSGSADVLASLGLKIPLDEAEAADLLRRCGFTFLFAPYYHPAMKVVAPVRQALGVGTIFNLVGPLANPAQPGFSVLGAPSLEVARRLAEALSGLELSRAHVVHGAPGWDEPTPVGPYLLIEVEPGRTTETVEDPAEFGVPRCVAGDLAGGDSDENAASLRRALGGEPGPHRDALTLGASLALRVTGRVADPREAIAVATAAIDDGRAADVLDVVSGYQGVEVVTGG